MPEYHGQQSCVDWFEGCILSSAKSYPYEISEATEPETGDAAAQTSYDESVLVDGTNAAHGASLENTVEEGPIDEEELAAIQHCTFSR